MRKTIMIAAATALAAWAQDQDRVERKEVRVEVVGEPGFAWHGSPGTFAFVSAEASHPGKTVTGAPYTADGLSETVRTLGDGTRITQRSSAKFARDSQGRTREERTVAALGPWAASGEAPRIVTITDPVAREVTILEEKEKTARRFKMGEGGPRIRTRMAPEDSQGGEGKAAARKLEERFEVMVKGPGGPPPGAMAGPIMMFRHDDRNTRTEPLGKQTMEGLVAEGTRITGTIPAGEIGNDRPIVNVTERWVSADLQVLVRSIMRDPQMGETSYRLSNIRRGEPDKSLFQVPAGYTVQEGGPRIERRMKKGVDN